MSPFTGVDFYNLESLLSEEERAVRDTVRAWVDDQLMPVIGELLHRGTLSQRTDSRPGRARRPRCQPAGGVRLCRAQQRGLWADHAGAGARRQRDPLLCLGAGGPGDVSDLSPSAVGGPEASAGCPPMAAGKDIGCFGLTEPDYGSNPAGMITTATETPMAGCSTAPRCGSPTVRRPPSRWSGPRPADWTT